MLKYVPTGPDNAISSNRQITAQAFIKRTAQARSPATASHLQTKAKIIKKRTHQAPQKDFFQTHFASKLEKLQEQSLQFRAVASQPPQGREPKERKEVKDVVNANIFLHKDRRHNSESIGQDRNKAIRSSKWRVLWRQAFNALAEQIHQEYKSEDALHMHKAFQVFGGQDQGV